jgi:anti-sigma factor RsiW
MNCVLNQHEQEELLLGYTTGSLDAATARTYQKHLTTCPDCQRLVDLQTEVFRAMSAWEAPAVSEGFDARLMAQLRAQHPPPSWSRRLVQWLGWPPAQHPFRWAMAGMPLAALALGLYFWPQPETNLQQAFDAQELQEVERSLADIEALQALHPSEKTAAPQELL